MTLKHSFKVGDDVSFVATELFDNHLVPGDKYKATVMLIESDGDIKVNRFRNLDDSIVTKRKYCLGPDAQLDNFIQGAHGWVTSVEKYDPMWGSSYNSTNII